MTLETVPNATAYRYGAIWLHWSARAWWLDAVRRRSGSASAHGLNRRDQEGGPRADSTRGRAETSTKCCRSTNSGAFADAGSNPAETLMNVVALIAKRFRTDVCSAYLLEPDRANLVLAATLGLRPECIGTLRMGLHEGLAGPGRRAGAPGRRRTGHRRIRASSTSAKPAKSRSSRSSAFRSSIAACCRACSSCRRSRRAYFSRRGNRGAD